MSCGKSGGIWKHPHVRGEDYSSSINGHQLRETPPRAWGRRLVEKLDQTGVRNTPTCVGKTKPLKNGAKIKRKHPHVRGEDPPTATALRTSKETPPRAWGRQAAQTPPPAGGGNTPTCVGKTKHLHLRGEFTRKHPHVRGEDLPAAGAPPPERETPPRAWGRHQHIVKEREFNHNIHVLRQF